MIKPLTSLRMIFALMVFGAHCYVIDDLFNAHVFKEGFVGVNFFFVLSGFIIAYNYHDQFAEHKVTKRSFWIARFARIYPLHWLTLLVAVFVGGFAFKDGVLDWLSHFLASFTLTQGFIPKMDYFFSFNSPSWSLCCEQLFYISFPFVISKVKSGKKLFLFLLACGALMISAMHFTPEDAIRGYWYVNPITRFPDFLVGILLLNIYNRLKDKEISFRKGTLYEIGSILFFIAFYLYSAEIPKVYRYSVYYWIPVAAILLVFALQKGWVSKLLCNKILFIGGEISFGFYLIHLFVIDAFMTWQKGSSLQIGWELSIPLIFLITIILSSISYTYFEKPMNKWVKEKLGYKRKIQD